MFNCTKTGCFGVKKFSGDGIRNVVNNGRERLRFESVSTGFSSSVVTLLLIKYMRKGRVRSSEQRGR